MSVQSYVFPVSEMYIRLNPVTDAIPLMLIRLFGRSLLTRKVLSEIDAPQRPAPNVSFGRAGAKTLRAVMSLWMVASHLASVI